MAQSFNKLLLDLTKMEPLDGVNYKRWSQRMLIFLEQLEVDYVLFSDPVQVSSNTTTLAADDVTISKSTSNAKKDKEEADDPERELEYEKDNKTVRGLFLSHMTNSIFDLFINNKSAKSIWEIMER